MNSKSVLLLAGGQSKIYYFTYIYTEPIAWLLNAWVLLELYSLVLKDYQGLYSVGRWCLLAAVTMALIGSSLTVLLPSHATRQGHLIAFYYLVERAVYTSMVFFLITILLLLVSYPITLTPNTIVHSVYSRSISLATWRLSYC